ncbi:MAG: hypothetical protein GY821_07155, partial [Gammaproteobacteria bacterium]|nr:hypothetical protein [Gammaproteobacteria bacterium]
ENNGGPQQNYNDGQNYGNYGQNHDRNDWNNYRKPGQLCRRYGLRSECSFDTFEFDFRLACKIHQIPARDKVNWLLMHLEGFIKEHTLTWLKGRGLNNEPTYEELINELRPSFQQQMSIEVAERRLVGRKWNMFTPIDAFLHETRELVHCALPGLTQQWPDRIRSCLMQALPPIWDQILSCSNKSYQQMVEWIRAQSVKIQNDPQEEWEDWVKSAYEQNQKAEASSNFCGIPQQQQQPQQYNRLHEPPPYAQSQNWHPPN